jgi:hypothetical protein
VSPGSGTPTGSVQFFNGSTSLGSATVINGVAVLTVSNLPAGSSSITANYSGSSNFNASSATAVSQQVNKATATGTITVSNANPFGFQQVTATAMVAGAPGTATPTGTVTFFDSSGMNLGSSTLTNGAATLSGILPVGPQSVTAVYSGDSNFASSTSPAYEIVVGSRSELFVNQVYLDVTGAPSGEQEAYWVALLDGGYPRQPIARDIIATSQAHIAQVQNAYQTFLRRPASGAEVARALTARNRSLNTIDAGLLSSKEYFNNEGGGTNNGFLTALALDWLDKPFSPRTQASYARQLQHGVSRSQVVREVMASPTGVKAELDQVFETILGRPATRRENSLFGPLIQRGQITPVAVTLFGTTEFARKYVNIVP